MRSKVLANCHTISDQDVFYVLDMDIENADFFDLVALGLEKRISRGFEYHNGKEHHQRCGHSHDA